MVHQLYYTLAYRTFMDTYPALCLEHPLITTYLCAPRLMLEGEIGLSLVNCEDVKMHDNTFKVHDAEVVESSHPVARDLSAIDKVRS